MELTRLTEVAISSSTNSSSRFMEIGKISMFDGLILFRVLTAGLI